MPRFNWTKLFILISSSLFCQIYSNVEDAKEETKKAKETSAAEDALGDIKKPKINPEDPMSSGKGLTDMILNMEDHGWAIIDRIRNSTEFPVDIFYNKTLHDLLPPESVIRIKSLKQEYSLNAETENKTTAGKTKPFRYLSARNIAGNFRLKADTTDPEDPATRFIIRKHIQADLQTFLGIEAEVNPDKLLRTKKNNEAIFSKTSGLDFIIKSGKKSSDNFDSDFDSDSQWLLYAKGLTPQDPIDPTVGSYLKSCGLKNRNSNSYLSIRGAEDQSQSNNYQKPACYWYWPQGLKWGDNNYCDYNKLDEKNWEDGLIGKGWTDAIYTLHLELMRVPLTRATSIPLEGSPTGIKTMLASSNFGKMLAKNMQSPNQKLPGELVKKILSPSGRIRDNRRNSRWQTIEDREFEAGFGVGSSAFEHLEQGLMIYNKLRDIEYMKSADQSGGSKIYPLTKMPDGSSLLEKWSQYFAERNKGSQRHNILQKKRTIHYGDKIKLVSTGSCLTLFGSDINVSGADGIKTVFGSHDDTETEYKKLTSITSPIPKNMLPEDYSWFYVKGPHDEGDRWNCNLGEPVKDGDIVRLEHFVTGRNLTINRTSKPAESLLFFGRKISDDRDFEYKGTSIVKVATGASARLTYPAKQKEHESLIGLSKETTGLGGSNDNFIVKFTDPIDSTLSIGQTFSLVSQNSKQNLWSQHAYFKPNGKDLFGLVSALFPEKDEDTFNNQWFALAQEANSSPVKDVAWVGVPDGAAQTSAGDKEELEIEIVKLGLGGNLGTGETLQVKMPLFKKEPKIGGFAKDTIPQFSSANIVELSPLLGKGVAWLEESLKTPNQAAVFFRAKCGDTGDIQIFLGSTIGLDYVWKIIIGGNNNSASYIIKKDFPGGVPVEQKVMEVYKETNAFAAAIPGQYIPYWISIDDGLIIVGAGSILGENIIMVWKDLAQREAVNRIGFGSGTKPVSYAEVKITDPMEIKGPKNFYFSQLATGSNIVADSEHILKFDGITKNSDLIFKVPGNAAMTCNINNDSQLYFFEKETNKSFSIDSSSSAIDAKLTKTQNELSASLLKKVAKIKNILNLQQFFSATTNSENTTDDSIKTISDFFFEHPDHSLKKYLDQLPDQEKNLTLYSKLQTMLSQRYSKDLHGSWNLDELKSQIEEITEKYLLTKFSEEIESKTYTPELKSKLTELTLNKSIEIDYSKFISQAGLVDHLKNISTINDHYRLSFKSFATIEKQRKIYLDKIIATLKQHLVIVLAELGKSNLFSQENINKILTEKEPALINLAKTNGISSINVGEIKNRISSSKEFLEKLKSDQAELFKKIFPDPLVEYYVQNISEFSSACITLEKYLSTKNSYEQLVSSKQQDSKQLDVSVPGGKNFWLSFNKNRFFLGEGLSVGEKLLLYAQDISNPYEDVQTLGFQPSSTGAQISNIKIGNTIKLTLAEQDGNYKQEKNMYDYSGSLQILSPYEYQLSQADQQVEFKDIIGKKTLFPGKTPQQGALYFFTLELQPNGFPALSWTKEPENKLKIELDKKISIAQATADAEFQAASYVQGGQNAISGLIGTAASITFAGLGTTQAITAGEDKALSAARFRSNDAYVFTDSMGSMPKIANSKIPPEVLENKDKAEAQLALGEKWTPSDVEKLQRLIPLYNSVLDYITHPYVILGSKNRLYSGINSIYKASKILFAKAKTVDVTQVNLLSLLLKGYNNAYLFDPSDEQNQTLKQTWYSYINELSQVILASEQKELSLPACYGEYIWIPEEFKFINKGSVTFKAKANSNIFICFASEATNVRNSDKDIYEVVLGAFDNQKSIIRAKSLDKAVAATTNPDSLVNPIDLKQYWVSFNNGRIIIGTGDLLPENAIGQYDEESKEITKPEWGEYSYSITLNPEWLKYAIGDEKGFRGKDLLLKDLKNTTNADEIASIKTSMSECKTQLAKLFSQKNYAYKTSATEQGSFSTDPFLWQDPYFNPKINKIKRVGLSSWNSEVSFQDIKVSVCVEEISLYYKNLIAQINNNTDKPIFDNDPTTDSYRNKILETLEGKFTKKSSGEITS